jgi:hypothetical protein
MRPALSLSLLLCCLLAGCGRNRLEPTTPLPLPVTRVDGPLSIRECDEAPSSADEPVLLRTSTRCVEVSLRLADVSGSHRMRFLYYDSRGNLYASTKTDWTVEPEGGTGYHRSATVRHRLAVAGEQASMLPGLWKAAVWLDGLTVSEKLFRLQSPAAPRSPELDTARQMYLRLRYEEALEKLETLGSAAGVPAVESEALWWLALVQHALSREADATRTLARLLDVEPGFSLDPDSLGESGGEMLAHRLEELRVVAHPGLYRKSIAPPELELSPAEAPPVLGKPARWYQRWWFYAGLGAIAVPVTAVLAKGALVSEPGPPSVRLGVIERDRDPISGLHCDGAIDLELTVEGGKPPYEVIFTVGALGSTMLISVEGIGMEVDNQDWVMLKQTFKAPGSIGIRTPRIDVLGDFSFYLPGIATFVRFGVILKDSASESRFDLALVGRVLPESIRALPTRDRRVLQRELVEGLIVCGHGAGFEPSRR